MTTITQINFKEQLQIKRQQIDVALAKYLCDNQPLQLWDAMRYSTLSAGKRIRAILCLSIAEALGSTIELAMPCAAAIEMVHAFSLIHDDLPAIDNDDFRRSRPTNHKVFGEAMAIMAGDALLAFAFQTLITKTKLESKLVLTLVSELAEAVGVDGMVAGQVMDLNFTGNNSQLTENNLENMHRMKTGALMRFACQSGALIANAEDKTINKLGQFGENLGLAFQIADDLLDVVGNRETLGKTPGKDLTANKANYVLVFGQDKAKQRLDDLQRLCKQIIQDHNLTEVLYPLLEYAIYRSY